MGCLGAGIAAVAGRGVVIVVIGGGRCGTESIHHGRGERRRNRETERMDRDWKADGGASRYSRYKDKERAERRGQHGAGELGESKADPLANCKVCMAVSERSRCMAASERSKGSNEAE